jgi:hypothetical protein
MNFLRKIFKRESAPVALSGLTITDGKYGRLEHLLSIDPDDYGWRGKEPEEMLRLFNTPVSPRERYGFDHDLTLDDIQHALTGAYKRGDLNG